MSIMGSEGGVMTVKDGILICSSETSSRANILRAGSLDGSLLICAFGSPEILREVFGGGKVGGLLGEGRLPMDR